MRYYLNKETGNDQLDGLCVETAWKTRAKANSMLKSGDTLKEIRRNGYTIIGIALSIVSTGCFLLAMLFFVMANAGLKRDKVEESAYVFTSNLYPELKDIKVVCSETDTKFRDYIRCTVSGLNENHERKMFTVECSESTCVLIKN